MSVTSSTVRRRSQVPGPGAPALPRPGVPAAARDLLGCAARGIVEAAAADQPRQRYALAHLAALRTAAAVLACRSQPAPRRRGGPRSAWELLAKVAPEFGEWATFFAAGAGKRAAAEAGVGRVTDREAADLVRESERFLALVCDHLGVIHQPGLALLSHAG